MAGFLGASKPGPPSVPMERRRAREAREGERIEEERE
jgi:hypothetical protein